MVVEYDVGNDVCFVDFFNVVFDVVVVGVVVFQLVFFVGFEFEVVVGVCYVEECIEYEQE